MTATKLRPMIRTFAVVLLAASGAVAGSAGCSDCNKTNAGAGGPEAAASGQTAADAATSVPDGGALNVTSVPASVVASMVNPDQLPPYDGPTGSVEGIIEVTGDRARETPADFSRCPEAAATWGHAFRESEPQKNGRRLLADAIVVVTGYKGFFLPEKEEAKEVRIEGCAYQTRTVTMTFGQRLEVKNLSKDFWTPMLEPQPSVMVSMATPGGDPAKLYPKKPGHYLLLDRDRKYVVVDVYAFLHPLHAATDVAGHYRIDGLPAGKKLKISTTHSQIDASAEAELTVAPGVVHRVDLTLKNVNKDAAAPAQDAAASYPIIR